MLEVAREELKMECDYLREMRAANKFRELLKDLPDYYVPKVFMVFMCQSATFFNRLSCHVVYCYSNLLVTGTCFGGIKHPKIYTRYKHTPFNSHCLLIRKITFSNLQQAFFL